jgi:tRNA pseudouridine38-40 synthase
MAAAAEVSRLELEYDGSGFSGWARQPGKRTIQDEVERALAVLLRVERVGLTVAGRTDTGVHALGQIASYVGPPVAAKAMNGLLADDVAVLSCEAAAEGFDARRDATSRAYSYLLLNRPTRSALQRGRALWWPRVLDIGALETCAAALVGTHDFTAFTPTDTEHVRFSRDVYAAYWRARADGLAEFWIEADAFMRNMVRVLVGTMLEVAVGSRSVAEFVALLSGRPRAEAGRTAPAHGLYLVGVGYGGARVLGGGRGPLWLASAQDRRPTDA